MIATHAHTPIVRQKSKSPIPVVPVLGVRVREYSDAVADLKAAEAKVKEIKPILIALGLPEIVRRNLDNPGSPISSVKLTDLAGGTVTVSNKDSYSVTAEADVIDKAFESLGLESGKYVHQHIVAGFDSDVFNVDGHFDLKRFEAFQKAINKVAAKLGVQSPLTTKVKISSVEGFHDIRWTIATTTKAQKVITEVLPNTVSLIPVVA